MILPAVLRVFLEPKPRLNEGEASHA
jgi:hypothetical protein